jgi:hypothetical protein
MNESARSVKEQLWQVWREYDSIIQRNINLLEEKPTAMLRITFRMESAKFYIDQLGFWNEMGDLQGFEETANRARKSLEDVYHLINKFIEESPRDAE